MKKFIAVLAAALLWPASAIAHAPSVTERIEAKYAALEVEVEHCVKHKHSTDCVVVAKSMGNL